MASFLLGFPTKSLYAFLFPSIRDTCPYNLFLLVSITRIKFLALHSSPVSCYSLTMKWVITITFNRLWRVLQVCVSCCDEMYCNISVPSNQSTAVYSDRRTKAKRRSQQHHDGGNSTSTASRQWLPTASSQTPTHLFVAVLAMTVTMAAPLLRI